MVYQSYTVPMAGAVNSEKHWHDTAMSRCLIEKISTLTVALRWILTDKTFLFLSTEKIENVIFSRQNCSMKPLILCSNWAKAIAKDDKNV